jgi:XTP/dITP diphosphohydrolase
MGLVLATHNPGKLTELRALLRPMAIELVDAGALGLAAPDESGESYVGNATIKAVAAATASAG